MDTMSRTRCDLVKLLDGDSGVRDTNNDTRGGGSAGNVDADFFDGECSADMMAALSLQNRNNYYLYYPQFVNGKKANRFCTH